MRATFLFAAALALSACGQSDQNSNVQNADDNLSSESIVSNDVTAIDAVTGDAANMAADVDMNFGNLPDNGTEAATPEPAKKTSKAPVHKADTATSNTATNAVANSE